MHFYKLKTKFLFIFIIISIIPIVIVTIISYRSYTHLISSQVSLVSSNALSNAVERTNHILQDINRISETLVYQQYLSQSNTSAANKTIEDELQKYNSNSIHWDQYDFFISRQNMRSICENLMYNYDYINGIYIFFPSGNYFSYGNGTDLKINYQPFHDDWYQKTIQRNGKLYISDAGTKEFIINAQKSILFARVLFDTTSHQFLGVLMLDCGLDIFKGLDKDLVPNTTSMYLINENGNILFDNSKAKIGEHLPRDLMIKISGPNGSMEDPHQGLLTVYQTFPKLNWKLVAIISTKELNRQFGATRKLIIYISLTCIVIFIMLSILLSNLVTKPITELSDIMHKNESHQLVTTKKYLARYDEVGILYTEYNNMINEINDFIKESYQNKLITLDSQMKALEAQINSHFLYNTLESINSIAEIEGVTSIAVMSKALGDMFRYSIKTKSELVTIEEELTHVHNYLAIQKIRYEDKIDFKLSIEDDLYSCKILKLVLQPIIENAIYHGLENKKGQGGIEIKGYSLNDKIYFEINDDGVGMSPEQIKEIKELLSEPPKFTELGQRNKRSIGIKNVHSRIELYYGAGYGLTLESKLGLGTAISICIPKIS